MKQNILNMRSAVYAGDEPSTGLVCRRRSIVGLGATSSLAVDEAEQLEDIISLRQHRFGAEPVSDTQIALLTDSLLSTVQRSNTVENAVTRWYETNLPEGSALSSVSELRALVNVHNALLVRLGGKIRPLLKIARIGLAVRLVVALILSYQDMATDILVGVQFLQIGKLSWASLSLGFVVLSILLQITFTWAQYRQKHWTVTCFRILVAALLLNPLAEGYNMWVGVRDAELTFSPTLMLGIVRYTEIVAESLPESVLQVTILLCTGTEAMPLLQVVSILSSILAVGYIIADTNITSDLRGQDKNILGRTDKFSGLVPLSSRRIMFLYICLTLFISAFWTTTTVAFSTLALTVPTWVIPMIVFVEFHAILFFKRREPVSAAFPATLSGNIGSVRWYLCVYLTGMLYYSGSSIAPWWQLRIPSEIGGLFWRVVVYRILFNVAVFFSLVGLLRSNPSVISRIDLVVTVFVVSVLLSILAGALVLFFGVTSTHRHTFFSTASGKEFMQRRFRADILIYRFRTKDEQRAHIAMHIHPLYLSPEGCAGWVMELSPTQPLLKNGVLPASCKSAKVSHLTKRLRASMLWWRAKGAKLVPPYTYPAVLEKLDLLDSLFQTKASLSARS